MSHKIFHDVVWFDPGEPATEKQIAAIEQAVGVSIPQAYRAWLASVNGGTLDYGTSIPRRGIFRFVAWHRAGDLEGDLHDRWGNLLFEWATTRRFAWFADRLPAPSIPIARTGGESDALILDLSPESYGAVHAWISARPDWAGGGRDELITIAPSFERFLEQLTVSEDEAVEAWEEAHGNVDAELIEDVRAWLAHALPNWQPPAPERSLEQ
jgi:hypothetical protein